jgi:hypothetical protein
MRERENHETVGSLCLGRVRILKRGATAMPLSVGGPQAPLVGNAALRWHYSASRVASLKAVST